MPPPSRRATSISVRGPQRPVPTYATRLDVRASPVHDLNGDVHSFADMRPCGRDDGLTLRRALFAIRAPIRIPGAGYSLPMETPKDLVEEAQGGRSERTPWLALTGVTLVVGALVAVILAVALIVYFTA
jgi:hypothetical protein